MCSRCSGTLLRGRLALILALVAIGSVFLALVGCAPMIYGGSTRPPHFPFVVTVTNLDVAFAETASISWWKASTIIGHDSRLVPPGGSVAFVIGDADGFELDTVAWPAQQGGLVFQSPDWAGSLYFDVDFPTGAGRRR